MLRITTLLIVVCLIATATPRAALAQNENADWVETMPVSINGLLPKDPMWTNGREKLQWHDAFELSEGTTVRKSWKAEDFFDDPQVIKLCQAIFRADLKEMKKLIEADVDVNTVGADGMNPLYWAFHLDTDPRPFGLLLKHGANPNQIVQSSKVDRIRPVQEGLAVTHLVCVGLYNRHFKNVFEAGGDPNLTNQISDLYPSPLPSYWHVFPWAPDSAERVQLLIDKGAKLDVKSNGVPFVAARCTNDERFCKIALVAIKAGAEYNVYYQQHWFKECDGSYFRLIHCLAAARYNTKSSSRQTHSRSFDELVKFLEEKGQSFKDAKEDVARWKYWTSKGGQADLLEKERQEREKLRRKRNADMKKEGDTKPDAEPACPFGK